MSVQIWFGSPIAAVKTGEKGTAFPWGILIITKGNKRGKEIAFPPLLPTRDGDGFVV